jgi:hypothetical protein
MGNLASTPTPLPSTDTINKIINNILNEKNTFINPEYNFLSEVVCDQYQIVFEEELSKHLKVELSEYGSTVFLLPRQKISRIPKSEICQRISSHYVRILYILTLIKYIYNLENNGDNSFSGIIFRNITIDENFIHIKYCNSEQFDKMDNSKRRLNLNKLPGFRFLIQFVLDRYEGKAFLGILRAMFGRSSKRTIQTQICTAFGNGNISKEEMSMLAFMFKRHYREPLQCVPPDPASRDEISAHVPTSYANDPMVKIEPRNPVFDASFCNLVDEKKYIPKNSAMGKALMDAYKQMRDHYQKNLKEIEGLLNEIVTCGGAGKTWALKDLTSTQLDAIVANTKAIVRKYVFQTLFDYHYMLDIATKNPK